MKKMWKLIIWSPFLGILTSILCFSGVVSESHNHLVFPPLPIAVDNSSNQLCQLHSDLYRQNLNNFTLWAYEMWDATAKSPTGFLRGSVFQMGHFEECITANAPFKTQYCLALITANIPAEKTQRKDPISLYHPPNEYILDKLYPHKDKSQQDRNSIQLGWCIPASCGLEDLEVYLNNYIEELDLPLKHDNVTFSAKFSPLLCNTNEEITLNSADIIFCTICLFLAITVIFVTAYSYREKEDEKPTKNLIYRLAIAFSAKTNFNELTRREESDAALAVMYGMRTICIMCIILDHRFGTFTSSALLNFDYVEQQYRALLAPLLFHGDLFVDSFFLFSGLLVAYGLLNQFSKRILNPGFIILLRYIRLTPVYALVIFYYATMFNYTGTGPLWKLIAGQDSQDCKDNWWTNLLYINNYVNADHMCMTHAWYLPCDFHYFIIGIGVCLLIHKNKKWGLTTLLLLVIVATLIPFALNVIYARPALLHFYPDFLTGPKTHPDFLLTYSKSHTRATPYFVGMFAGYLYFRLKGTNKHVGRTKSYTILIVSLALIIVAIVGGAAFYNPYHPYNVLESGAYAALHRPAFAIGSVGVIYITSFGHASFLYKILTWSPWIPLSKLSYGAYLVHLSIQIRSAAKFMNPRQISYIDVMCLAFSDMFLAFATSLLLYLAVEAPLKKIFRELLMPPRANSIRENGIEKNLSDNTNTSQL